MATKVYKPEYPGLYYFDTFTFTTLGASGNRGPDSTKGYANAPWNPDQFSIVDGQQQWTVPATGTYNIVAAGAYGAMPGRVVSGDVNLSEGQTLTMLVGQQPTPLTSNAQDNVTVGGGGGTFVVSDGVPLIVASGGDGSTSTNQYNLTNTRTYAYGSTIIGSTISADGSTTALSDGTATYIYRYNVLQATLEPIAEASNGIYTKSSISLTSDGNKLAACMVDGSLVVFKYQNSKWIRETLGVLAGAFSASMNQTGTKVLFLSSFGDIYAYVYSGSSWVSTYINPLYTAPDQGVCISLSGDGNTGVISGHMNVYSVNYTGSSWTFGALFPRKYSSQYGIGVLCSTNYDGTVTAVVDCNSNIIYIYRYSSGSWSEYLLRTNSFGFYGSGISLSSDGNTVSFMSGSAGYYGLSSGSLLVYKYSSGWSLAYTISEPNGDIHFGAFISMNSATSKIIAPGDYSEYTYTQPIPLSGAFSPSGLGTGGSGAGYYTDGSGTDPFFGFLTPKAYVNGGFGNSYEYGQIAEEGGFGGGQSPFGILTSLTSITGRANVYPNLSGTQICMSSNNTVALVRSDGSPSTANVYRYSNGSWSSGVKLYSSYSLSTGSKPIALSQNGNTAFVADFSDVYVYKYNGSSWSSGTRLNSDYTSGQLQQPSVSTSSDGNTAFMCGYDASYGHNLEAHALIYKYNGSSWSTGVELPWSVQPFYIVTSSMSLDGNTAAYVDNYKIVRIFRYSGGAWSASASISVPLFEGSGISKPSLSLSSNGNTILVGSNSSMIYVFKYSSGSWITTTITNTNLSNFGQSADISQDGTIYYIGSNSKLSIYKNDTLFDTVNGTISYVSSSASSIFAYSNSYSITFGNVASLTTTCTATTSYNHGYPYDYEVQITGTNSFNGTWLITAGSPNTFTFQAFGGPTETYPCGYVSGTTTGISGGGGYTGSAGDGVSGATCYADSTIANFTDLGAASNSAGYVTVSLVDPVPLQPTWSWDDESPWETINSFQSNAYTVTWCESLGLFVVGGKYTPLTVNISRDGKEWQQTNTTYYDNYQEPMVSATDKPIIVWGAKTSVDGLNWVENNKLYGFVVYCNGMFINSVNYDIYTSTDGFTWNIAAFSTLAYTVRAYGNNKYVGISSNGYGRIVYSGDLITWNYANSTGGEYGIQYTKDVSFGNGVFVSYNTNNDIYTSTDGISWTYQTFPNDFPGTIQHLSNLIFGGSIFLVVKEYVDNSHPVTTTSSYFYTSSHGNTWTKGVVALNYVGIISITYSPSLDFFIFLSQSAFPYLTLDGQYFVPGGNYFVPYNFTNIVYSPTSGVIVVGNYTSTDQGTTWTLDKLIDPVDYDRGTTSYNVLSNDMFFKFMSYYNSSMVIKVRTYTSFDGLDWTYEGENDFELFGIPFWCQSRGYFIANGKYLSKDGVNWTLLGNQNMVVTAYSETLGLFTGYDSNDQYQQFNGQNYYSYDGYSWTLADESGINPISWSSSLELFAGVKFMYYSYEENKPFFGIFVSSNGINWELSYLFSDATPRGVTWSPELEKFFVYLPGKSNDPSYFYDKFIESSDGYNWSTVQLSTTSNPNYWKDTFAWVSGLDRFVLSHDELVSIRVLFSTKAIRQF